MVLELSMVGMGGASMTPEQFAEAFFVVKSRSVGKNGREWNCVPDACQDCAKE